MGRMMAQRRCTASLPDQTLVRTMGRRNLQMMINLSRAGGRRFGRNLMSCRYHHQTEGGGGRLKETEEWRKRAAFQAAKSAFRSDNYYRSSGFRHH